MDAADFVIFNWFHLFFPSVGVCYTKVRLDDEVVSVLGSVS